MLGDIGLTPKKRHCKIRLCNEEDQQQLGRGQAERRWVGWVRELLFSRCGTSVYRVETWATR